MNTQLSDVINTAFVKAKEGGFKGIRVLAPLDYCFICREPTYAVDIFIPGTCHPAKRFYVLGVCENHFSKKVEYSEFIEELLEDIEVKTGGK